jgi:methyl-accepting chemotaxis protein
MRATMAEQGEESKQILRSIENVQEITSEVQRSAEAMREGSRRIIRESTVIEQIMVEIQDRI